MSTWREWRRSVVARRMAVVPQDTHLAFDFTALEVVLMGRYPHLSAFEIEGPRDIAIARDALAATGTLALEDRLFDTLSGGERQRVVIAAALAQISGADNKTGVLLLDEPTAALDLAYQLEVAVSPAGSSSANADRSRRLDPRFEFRRRPLPDARALERRRRDRRRTDG